ncbi:MAG: rod shape-determining protein MreB [Clostridia bacterium]|nr:rod shape-determining protein MreB [Clostridia bacterium]
MPRLIQELGIDLGTTSVLVYVPDKGVVLREPSLVAIDASSKKIRAVGDAAQSMLSKIPGEVIAIRPLKDGVISDYFTTEKMLRNFLLRLCKNKILKPRVVICVPSSVTEVEKRAVVEAAEAAGARQALVIEEPLAAAIGAGIDITRPVGSLVVDIGGGTTDTAVISFGGIVVSNSIKTAGNRFDEAIVRYIRDKYGIAIGERTAEDIKINIGCVFPRDEELSMEVLGRSLVSGLPKTITVTSSELLSPLTECFTDIIDSVHTTLSQTPPELVADISTSGIVLTGGGSLISGCEKLLQRETGLSVTLAEDAVACVAKGTGLALSVTEYINR